MTKKSCSAILTRCMLMTPKKSENFDEMQQNEAFHQGIHCLLLLKDIKDIQRKKYLFGNDNL